MARAVNNIVTIASSKNTRAVLLNDQRQSLSQTFIGTVNGDALLTQSTKNIALSASDCSLASSEETALTAAVGTAVTA